MQKSPSSQINSWFAPIEVGWIIWFMSPFFSNIGKSRIFIYSPQEILKTPYTYTRENQVVLMVV